MIKYPAGGKVKNYTFDKWGIFGMELWIQKYKLTILPRSREKSSYHYIISRITRLMSKEACEKGFYGILMWLWIFFWG